MAKYHKYVFDEQRRKFIGDFEKMYASENTEGFDSWHQEDSRQLARNVCLKILNEYNFNNILDIGCGKGTLTHTFKKNNNKVLGIDISKTAIKIAADRYPDIVFKTVDLNKPNSFEKFLESNGKFDLVFCSEILSYLKNWIALLNKISKFTDYCLINLFIPDKPIGFVKNSKRLLDEFCRNFDLEVHVTIHNERKEILLGKSRYTI